MPGPITTPAQISPKQRRAIALNQFVAYLTDHTGLPAVVVRAWVMLENGPNDNPLNISPGGRVAHYGSPTAAARATSALLHTPRYAPVLRAARSGSDVAVVNAIAASPWATDPDYLAKLRGTLARAKDSGFQLGDLNQGLLEDAGVHPLGAITDPIEKAAGSVETFLVDRSKLALAYVGLTAAAGALFVIGLQLATGAPGAALKAVAGARTGASLQGGTIPF